ncbi:hypothetical protein ACSVDE_03620 [Pseudalkalibacillus sp. Hm43]|uniref:hypothetical protein n=1 Tax=Pseudalkalibacillus sp. Hm43 TaxID=3450742 RepID=UPI003F41BFA0
MKESKKKRELYSDSALNPGYESGEHQNATNLFNVEASLGTSDVNLSRQDEEDIIADEIGEKEMMQHNKNE